MSVFYRINKYDFLQKRIGEKQIYYQGPMKY